MGKYVPRQGEFITLDFDPQSGHEQHDRRPAFVVSKTLFNQATGLAFVCPVTNTDRGYPFHVPVPEGSGVTGFVMTEQLRLVDFSSRRARSVGPAPEGMLDQVTGIIQACL
ncbi:MAG: type II toxin-antitoxin system PemK/MazF family toxin [Bacteroidetes bacterium]|nr:type II toxin-antitoxin system PemK/MazF family toxin [Bacteroidota bacterium]